ncbi:type II secretion system protein N (GspN) [Idiomarina aquatica]|uniref:Type II secretion system protein N n=1 Tax=Idiomarina aquatica TaxID=1327752 RepID=A0A4R6PPR3_9GAMM|nr:type II secretion system protein N [Idiomarina aquatica]TDP40173.1 type II secretion system protein N (GspN) [Idiomarina aquatica]
MKRWWLIAVYLLALLVMLPAKIIYWLPIPAQVSISQVSGSLWQGRIGSLQVQGVTLNDMQWDWQLLQLFTGEVAVDVRVPPQNNPLAVNGRISAGLTELAATDLRASGDLATLLQLANTRLPLKTQGNWNLSIDTFVVSDPSPAKWCNQLTGSANGRNIQVLVNGAWQSLGDFPVALGCAESGAVTLTMNGENSLGLAMQGDINSQDINISGTVRPNPRTPEGLAQMFQYLGQPDSQGRYRFSL